MEEQGNVVFHVIPGEKINQGNLKYAVFNADQYQNVASSGKLINNF